MTSNRIGTKRNKVLNWRLLIAFQLAATPAADAQLTGAIRHNAIEVMQKSCFATQRQGSPNVNLSDATLKQYCQCSAIYLADLLNEPLVRDIEAGKVKPNPIWNQMAAEYCRKNYQKY